MTLQGMLDAIDMLLARGIDADDPEQVRKLEYLLSERKKIFARIKEGK